MTHQPHQPKKNGQNQDRLISEAMRALRKRRKSTIFPFSDPELARSAGLKSWESRRAKKIQEDAAAEEI